MERISLWAPQTDDGGTDAQALTYTPATGLLAISGGNNVTITGTLPGGAAGGDLTGTYPNPTITANAVSSGEIADGAIATADLADNAVTSVKVVDGTLTNADINASAGIAVTKMAAGTNGQVLTTVAGAAAWAAAPTASGTAGGDLTGSYPNPTVANSAVTTAKIADGAVTDVKIAAIAPSKITASGATTGQVLKWNGANWTPQADAGGSGTVTNIATGAGLTGGPITATGTISLADAGVTTIKLADNSITTAKILDGTIATGDLADGSVTDIKVTTVAPSKLTAAGATTGQVLKWNGSNWTPQTDNGGTDSQTLSFTSPNLSISGGNSVNLSTINTDAQALTYTPATGLLAISGGNNVTITGTAPGGAAGGNLAGTYPNPTIAATAGNNVVTAINDGSTTGTVNTNRLNAAVVLDSEAPTAGDITGSFSAGLQIAANAVTGTEIANAAVGTTELADASVTSVKLATTGVAPNVYGSAITVPEITVDAQGRITAAISRTITGVPPGGTATGDLAGTYPNPTVDGLQGRPVSNTLPAKDDVLKWNGTAWAPGADATGGGGVGGGGDVTQVAYWGSATNIGGKGSFVYDEKNDRLGINTPSPLGNLHVTGSQFVSTTAVPSGNTYTVTGADYLIYGEPNPSGGFLTITLPLADPNKGRILIIKTSGNTAKKNVVRVTPSGSDTIDGIASYATLNATVGSVYAVILVSVGSGWQTISKSIF